MALQIPQLSEVWGIAVCSLWLWWFQPAAPLCALTPLPQGKMGRKLDGKGFEGCDKSREMAHHLLSYGEQTQHKGD